MGTVKINVVGFLNIGRKNIWVAVRLIDALFVVHHTKQIKEETLLGIG